jgi:alpha-1,3-rhamnosyl/mannosyltransferase
VRNWAVGIDDGFSMSRPTGIGRYSAAIMHALATCAPTISVHHLRHARLESVRPRPLRRALYLAWLASGVPGARLGRTLDLIHFTNFHVAPRKPRALRYASTVHDLVPFRLPGTKSRAYAGYLRRSIAHALRVADVVFADSFAVRDEIAEEFRVSRDAIRVVYVPPTIAPMSATEAQTHLAHRYAELAGAPFVLFVGALERRKNLVALVRGMIQLASTFRDVRLVLAGRPGLGYGEIAAAVEEANAPRRRVHVLTGCTDADLRALYSSCHLFAFPSLYEGYGIPLLEAMQCGAPIVATHIPTSVELTAGSAVLVGSAADALADGLATVLDSETLRASLVERGFTRVGCFTPERTAQQLVEGYGTVLERGG